MSSSLIVVGVFRRVTNGVNETLRTRYLYDPQLANCTVPRDFLGRAGLIWISMEFEDNLGVYFRSHELQLLIASKFTYDSLSQF